MLIDCWSFTSVLWIPNSVWLIPFYLWFSYRDENLQQLSPTSTSRSLTDSGIASLRINRQHSQVVPIYSSGSSDLDLVIVQHCALAEVLLDVSYYLVITVIYVFIFTANWYLVITYYIFICTVICYLVITLYDYTCTVSCYLVITLYISIYTAIWLLHYISLYVQLAAIWLIHHTSLYVLLSGWYIIHLYIYCYLVIALYISICKVSFKCQHQMSDLNKPARHNYQWLLIGSAIL